MSTLILAPKYVDVDLSNIRKWPVHVHVARIDTSDVEHLSQIAWSEVRPIAWAQLYRSQDEARAAVRNV